MIPAEIKKLAWTIWSFLKTDFEFGAYLFTAGFLTIAASLNYYFEFDDLFLEPLVGTGKGMLFYFLFYGTAYFSIAIPILWFSKSKIVLSQPQFWIRSLVFLGIIGIEGGIAISREWMESIGFQESARWAQKTTRQLESILLWVPVYYVFMKWNEPGLKDGLYGIRLKYEDLKPYVSMLWIMIPLIAAASFLPDFQKQYPIFKRILDDLPQGQTAKWASLGLFETSYLASFLSTELMFRGALVIGMSSLLGRGAILPMVSVYMFLHFGKPMGEAISSVFGGYILGVLAFQNRNIWGGIFIHSCVAFLMDLAASIQTGKDLFR